MPAPISVGVSFLGDQACERGEEHRQVHRNLAALSVLPVDLVDLLSRLEHSLDGFRFFSGLDTTQSSQSLQLFVGKRLEIISVVAGEL